MKNKIIAGIELGSSKTSVIVAQISIDETTYTKSINVIGVSSTESKGIKKGQIVNIDGWS